jgi:hypothetical protein
MRSRIGAEFCQLLMKALDWRGDDTEVRGRAAEDRRTLDGGQGRAAGKRTLDGLSGGGHWMGVSGAGPWKK